MQKAVSRFAETVKLGGEDIWIGARRQSQDWTWFNDVPLTDVKVWNQSKSSDFRVKAAVTKRNTIEARHPGNELPYICEYKVGSARCKETADHFEERNSCFVFYSDEFATWYDARNKCLKKGGDLATFANVDSSVGVGKLATSPHWIGLRTSWWTWLDEREVTFSNWQRGEPDNPSKMCVVISKENPWMWKTADCAEDHLRFICQRHDNTVQTPIPVALIVVIATVVVFCLCINRQRILRSIRKLRQHRYVKLPSL